MNRRLVLLLGLALIVLAPLAGTTIEPDSYYRAVIACDRPASAHDAGWKVFSDNVRNADNGAGLMRIEGNTLLLNFARIRGSELTNTLGKDFQGLVPRLVSAEKLGPSQAELDKAKAEQEKAAQKLAEENDPRGPVDAKGKPVYKAGSPEAEAQMRESAKEQDKAVAKFKKSGAWGNGPVTGEGLLGKPVKNTGAFAEDDDNFAASGVGKAQRQPAGSGFPEEAEDKRPLSQRIMNRGTSPAPAAAPRAAEDDADERPAPAPTNKFAKPAPPRQGHKKDDTLFKNQNQNNPPQHQAPNNFIGIWAYPQDRGSGDDDYRLVYVQLTGKDKPDLMSLKNAKRAGYVPESLRYTSLSAWPQ